MWCGLEGEEEGEGRGYVGAPRGWVGVGVWWWVAGLGVVRLKWYGGVGGESQPRA